jgi:hypothetical protein
MSEGPKSRAVRVADGDAWYTPGMTVNLIPTSRPGVFDLEKDPRGRYQVDGCSHAGVDQEDLLRVELRILRPD